MYALLGQEDMVNLTKGRLLELERQHYAIVLKIAEMDHLGMSSEAPERGAMEADLVAVARVIEFHQQQLGIVFTAPGRVDESPGDGTGDDVGTNPVGEESRT